MDDKSYGSFIVNGQILECVDSTHQFLKTKILQGEISDSFYVFAHSQSAGIGRHNREWSSPKEGSFSLSIAMPASSVPVPEIVTLFQAYCLQKMLAEQEQIVSQIKWPNDIYIKDWKLAGILTEKIGEFYLVGIGLNINQKDFSDSIASRAISLLQVDGKKRDILDFLLRFLALLEQELLQWKRDSYYFWDFLTGQWLYQNQLVSIFDPIDQIEREGIFENVLRDGSLQLLQGEESIFLNRGTLRKKS